MAILGKLGADFVFLGVYLGGGLAAFRQPAESHESFQGGLVELAHLPGRDHRPAVVVIDGARQAQVQQRAGVSAPPLNFRQGAF